MALSAALSPGVPNLGSSEFHLNDESLIVRRIRLTGTGQTITAAALGFTKVLWCSNGLEENSGAIISAVADWTNNLISLSAQPVTAIDITVMGVLSGYGSP